MFRYRNEKNYYVAHVDAAAGAITLGVVLNGTERTLKTAAVQVPPSTWQALVVDARADHFVVEWNGRRVFDVRDPTLAHGGAVGLWAPAECMAYFDELAVQPHASSPHPNDLLPFLLNHVVPAEGGREG